MTDVVIDNNRFGLILRQDGEFTITHRLLQPHVTPEPRQCRGLVQYGRQARLQREMLLIVAASIAGSVDRY